MNRWKWALILALSLGYCISSRPSAVGAWDLETTEQRVTWFRPIPRVYSTTINGRECLVMVGFFSDELQCAPKPVSAL